MNRCGRCRKNKSFCKCTTLTPEEVKSRKRSYLKSYFDGIDAIELPEHGFSGSSHCRACKTEYKRITMKLYRAAGRNDAVVVGQCRALMKRGREVRRLEALGACFNLQSSLVGKRMEAAAAMDNSFATFEN